MNTENQINKLNPKAVIAALTGFFFLALDGVLIKLEKNGSATIQWIVFMQYSTCLFIMIILAAKNRFRDLKTEKIKYHIIRGVAGIIGFTLYVTAITKISLVNASMLNNSAPVFIPVITLVWMKNKIDEKIWWGISIGFIGILFILKPSERLLFQTGDLFGLASGIFLAIAYVALKVLTKTESFVSILFYYSLIAFLLSVPFAINSWSDPPFIIWIYGILTGVFFIIYLYLLQFAYRFTEAVKLSPFNYSVIVFMGILDWILFDNIPDFSSIAGIILVTIGGILAIVLHEKENKDLKHHWH